MKPFHSFILAIALLIGCQDRPQPSLTPQKIRVEPVEIKPLPYYVNGEGDTIDISQPVKIEAKLDTNYRLPLQAVPIQNKKVTRFRDNVTPAKAPLIVPVEASMWDTLVHGDTLKSIIRTRSLKGKTVNLIKSPIKRVSQPITEGNPNYSITSLTTDLGLPSSNIIGFLQDSKGNIWINTEETLLRYDGKYIHSYQLQEMLIGGMQSIIEDEHQHIWVKSFNKLYYFDGFQFTVFDKDSGLFKNAKDITPLFASMNLDQQGNLWYGYWGEFGYISDSTITHFSGLSDLLMSRIFCDSKGNVWLENWEKSQLLKFDGNHILKLKTKIPNVTDESFAYLTEAKNGDIWMHGITKNALTLVKYDGNHFHVFSKAQGFNFPIENFFSRFEILGIYASLNGHIFILGKEGLTIYDGQNFTSIGKEQGIAEPGFYGISLHAPSNQFWFSSGKKIQFYRTEELPYFTPQELDYPKGKLFLDSKGNLWWNNLQEQLWFKLQEGNLHQLKVSPYTGFPDFEDKAGGIWSTHGNWGGVIEAKGTIRYTNDSIAFLPLENAVKNIFEDEEQQIWITTHGSKVHRINERGLTTLPCYADFTVGEAGVVCMSADKKGRMWITGSITNYLLRVDEHELSYFNFPVEAQEIIPYSTKDNNNIITDKEGNIWLLSGKRTLIKYDGSTFWKYDFRDYLDFSLVDFAKDEKDRLWLATSGDGLLQFDGQFLRFFRTTDGLLSDRMTAITCDFENRIWVTSNDGICALQEVESDNYYIHTFNQNKSKKSVFDKEFSFSEEKQLGFIGGTMFNLNAITTQKSIPQNFGLAQLDINQQFVDYQRLRDSSYLATLAFGKEIQASFSSVPKFLNYPLDLTLPHYLNHLTFYFTATDWEAPHKIRYSFKMDGIDGDWSPPQAEPVVDYRNLPHGQHTLLAKVKNESNLWSEPFRYQFTIRPPWWQTIWAYLAYGVMAIVGVLAYIRWRTKSLLKRQEALENTVTERTAEVVAEKERSEELLLNILPAEVAEELKQNGTSPARNFDEVTILFTDFKQFTALSEQMAPQALVAELNVCFKAFDEITTKYKIEKIKTIGDAYMAAGGLHLPRRSEPQEVVLAALEMQTFMLKRQKEQETIGKPFFEMRCGIHTGPVVAGIVGVKKFQYDIWGDTVNTAARMESNCEVGRVNMSQTTYELLKENKQFDFTPRGKVEAKGKGKVEMYFVDSTR